MVSGVGAWLMPGSVGCKFQAAETLKIAQGSSCTRNGNLAVKDEERSGRDGLCSKGVCGGGRHGAWGDPDSLPCCGLSCTWVFSSPADPTALAPNPLSVHSQTTVTWSDPGSSFTSMKFPGLVA